MVTSGTLRFDASVSTPAARSLRRCASRAMRSSAPPNMSSAMMTSTRPVLSSAMRIFLMIASVSNCCVVVFTHGFSSRPAGWLGRRASVPELTIDWMTWSASMLQSWMFMRSTLTTSSLPFGSTYFAWLQPASVKRRAVAVADEAMSARVRMVLVEGAVVARARRGVIS